MISVKQIDFFNKNGYLIVENVINDTECDKFLETCKNYSIENNENFTEILQAHNKIPQALSFLKNLKLLNNSNIIEGEAVGLQTFVLLKNIILYLQNMLGIPSG